jgi:hypothetical protein
MENKKLVDGEDVGSQQDRRNFLMSCGRFAAVVPPAMTVLLSTSLSSKAIARSTGEIGQNQPTDTGIKRNQDTGIKRNQDTGSKQGL